MNNLTYLFVCGCMAVCAGCATSGKMQERMDAHDASIAQLNESFADVMAKNQENARALAAFESRFTAMAKQQEQLTGAVDAGIRMSANNTAAVDALKDELVGFKESMSETLQQLGAVDELHEGVLMNHYQTVIDSAMAAMKLLKGDAVHVPNDVPVKLTDPIEIVAPETSLPVATNAPAAN